MGASLLVLFKLAYDVVKRLVRDEYFRALGTALLMMLLAGTLFFWLVEGRSFVHALAYAAGTLALNSPYGEGWGPRTVAGVVFNVFYLFLGAGLYLLFVLEAGKTMVLSYEESVRARAERKAAKREPAHPAARTPGAQ
jgi:hypothetical protein